MTRLKFAELTSGVGALVVGVGLGAFFPSWFGTSAGLITLAGVITHAVGMWDKHGLETEAQTETAPWVVVLYWACWLLLAVVVGLLFIRR